MRVRLYSKNSELLSSEPLSDVSVVSSVSTMRHEHTCQIRPAQGKFVCSYFLSTEQMIDVKVLLTKWAYAPDDVIDSEEELPVYWLNKILTFTKNYNKLF